MARACPRNPSPSFLPPRPFFPRLSSPLRPASASHRQALRAPRFIYNYIYAHAMPLRATPFESAANYCVYANCDGVSRPFLPWNNSSKKPASRITPTNFRLDPLVFPFLLPRFSRLGLLRSPSIRAESISLSIDSSVPRSSANVQPTRPNWKGVEGGGRRSMRRRRGRGGKDGCTRRFSSELKSVSWFRSERRERVRSVGRRARCTMRACVCVCTLVSRSG